VYPTEEIASSVVCSMTGEKVLQISRMITGDQHFVYDIITNENKYVIRMTDIGQKNKFISAIYWQEMLLPIGVPLAKFIAADLEDAFSPFPALLMMRLPGNDLCNVYLSLTDNDKYHLANEMVNIQAMTNQLPDGPSYGIADSYERITKDKSWYDFLVQKIHLFAEIIRQTAFFNSIEIEKVLDTAKNLEDDLREVRARPFLWDATERNVIVHNAKISGIVDVDEICFGDPLFVLGLTYTALENEGYDTLYCDYWGEALRLDNKAKIRLEFYRLFYVIVFMRKHLMISGNQQKIMFNAERLISLFQQSLQRLKKYMPEM